MSWNTVEIA